MSAVDQAKFVMPVWFKCEATCRWTGCNTWPTPDGMEEVNWSLLQQRTGKENENGKLKILNPRTSPFRNVDQIFWGSKTALKCTFCQPAGNRSWIFHLQIDPANEENNIVAVSSLFIHRIVLIAAHPELRHHGTAGTFDFNEAIFGCISRFKDISIRSVGCKYTSVNFKIVSRRWIDFTGPTFLIHWIALLSVSFFL